MKELIGKIVKEIFINSKKDLIRLVCKDGTLFLSAVGECCSTSWFEHMTGIEAIIEQEIFSVIDREMPGNVEKDDQVFEFYGWTLETSRGRCDIEMRNESNGYYGGTCEVSEKPLDQYGHLRDDESSAKKPVTDDF